jgi:hypothetical protein
MMGPSRAPLQAALSAALASLLAISMAAPTGASADPTTSTVWSSQAVGDPDDPPTAAELAAMSIAAATSKACQPTVHRIFLDDVFYAVDTDPTSNTGTQLVPVVEISHQVTWTGNCIKVYGITQKENETILAPGFRWESWNPPQVLLESKASQASVTISGTYGTCPANLTCVDNHHPFSNAILYANGRHRDSYGDPGAPGPGIGDGLFPNIVPNVGLSPQLP